MSSNSKWLLQLATAGSSMFPVEFKGSKVVKSLESRCNENGIKQTSKVFLVGKVMKAKDINEKDIEATFIVDEIATAAEVKRIEMEKKKAEKGKKKAEKDKTKPEQEQIIDDEAVPVVCFPIGTQFMVLGITEKSLDIQLSTNTSVQLRVPLEAVELWQLVVVKKEET